jgi:hypothetical protein
MDRPGYEDHNIHIRRCGRFSLEEDEELRNLVAQYGDNDWGTIAQQMNQNQKRLRDRWRSLSQPQDKSNFTPGEDAFLKQKMSELGHMWKKIARFFPNRSEVQIRNRGHFLIKRRKSRWNKKAEAKEANALWNNFLSNLGPSGEDPLF